MDGYYPRLDGRIRPPRTPAQIGRRLAHSLLDRLVAAGAQIVLVAYRTGLRGPRDVVAPYPSHEDHLHVRFPKPRSRGDQARASRTIRPSTRVSATCVPASDGPSVAVAARPGAPHEPAGSSSQRPA